MEWFRSHHGITSDPKWPIIARKAKTKVGIVVSIWLAVLEYASQNKKRGFIDGFDAETIDALYGYKDGVCQSVLNAMIEKNLIVDNWIVNWDKRQAGKDDIDAAKEADKEAARERKRLQREREKEKCDKSHDVTGKSQNVTDMSQGVTQSHSMSQDVTDCHAMSQDVTSIKTREDKTRLDLKNPPPDNDLDNINNAHARARVAQSVPEGGGFEENELDYPVDENTPSLEFQELREIYNRSARQEAPFTGYKEYLSLCKTRQWPGLAVIDHAITTLSTSDAQWLAGKAPGLSKFLNEHWWQIKPRSEPRASPVKNNQGKTTMQQNAEISKQAVLDAFQELKAEGLCKPKTT